MMRDSRGWTVSLIGILGQESYLKSKRSGCRVWGLWFLLKLYKDFLEGIYIEGLDET